MTLTWGLLWFNVGHKPLEEAIPEAAKYYAKKYGTPPNCCHVNKIHQPGGPEQIGDIRLRYIHDVQANHFWLGVLNQEPPKATTPPRFSNVPKPGMKGLTSSNPLAATSQQPASILLLPARCPDSPLFEHVDVPQRWYPTLEAWSTFGEGPCGSVDMNFTELLMELEQSRRRQRRLDNLFARFQREAAQLRQPAQVIQLPALESVCVVASTSEKHRRAHIAYRLSHPVQRVKPAKSTPDWELLTDAQLAERGMLPTLGKVVGSIQPQSARAAAT